MKCAGFLVVFQVFLTVVCIFIQPAFWKLVLPMIAIILNAQLWVLCGRLPHDLVEGVQNGTCPCRGALSSQVGSQPSEGRQDLFGLSRIKNYLLITSQHQTIGTPPKNLTFF